MKRSHQSSNFEKSFLVESDRENERPQSNCSSLKLLSVELPLRLFDQYGEVISSLNRLSLSRKAAMHDTWQLLRKYPNL